MTRDAADRRDRSTYFDVSEYGARPGHDGGSSVVAAWEAIRAKARALPWGTPSEVHFPPGAWVAGATLWADWDLLTISGHSPETTSLTAPNTSDSITLIVGLDRTPGGAAFPADRRPYVAAGTKLDGSHEGHAYRLGQRPGGGHHIAAHGTVADVGIAQWAGYQDAGGVRTPATRQLAIEVAFEYHGPIPQGMQLCGILDRYTYGGFERPDAGAVRPWSLWFSEPERWRLPAPTTPRLTLTLATTDGPESPSEKGYIANWGESREFEIDLGPVGPDTPIRLAVQVDLAKAEVTAYVDAAQVAVTPLRNADAAAGWKPESDLHFVRNECWPFKVAADGKYLTGSGSRGVRGELTIYGLAVATSLRYRDDGPGRPIRRIDAESPPPDDRWRYADDGTDRTAPNLWNLSGEVAPACDGRVAWLVHGRQSGSHGLRDTAFLCDSSGDMGPNGLYAYHDRVTVRDLTIAEMNSGHAGVYGAALAAHGVLGLRLRRLDLRGGWFGFQTVIADCMYPVAMDEISTQAAGAGLFLSRGDFKVRDLRVGIPGLYGIWMMGSDLDLDWLWSAGWNGRFGHCLIKRIPAGWGNSIRVGRIYDDTEGGLTPCEGMVVAERGDWNTPTCLIIDSITMQWAGTGAPLIALRGRDGRPEDVGSSTVGRCSIRGITCTRAPNGVVAVDSPHWAGTVDEPATWPRATWYTDAPDPIVVYTDRFKTGVAEPNVRTTSPASRTDTAGSRGAGTIGEFAP